MYVAWGLNGAGDRREGSIFLLLKDVQDEVMAPVVPALVGIIVVPMPVVDGDLHFRWIPMVHAVAAAVVLVAAKVLRVVDVGIVVKARAVPVAGRAPHRSISNWLGCVGKVGGASRRITSPV